MNPTIRLVRCPISRICRLDEHYHDGARCGLGALCRDQHEHRHEEDRHDAYHRIMAMDPAERTDEQEAFVEEVGDELAAEVAE